MTVDHVNKDKQRYRKFYAKLTLFTAILYISIHAINLSRWRKISLAKELYFLREENIYCWPRKIFYLCIEI